MTERRKLRCGEPSRICSRLKIAMQKVERYAYLKEYWEFFRGRLYIISSDKVVFKFRQSSIQKEHDCLLVFLWDIH